MINSMNKIAIKPRMYNYAYTGNMQYFLILLCWLVPLIPIEGFTFYAMTYLSIYFGIY